MTRSQVTHIEGGIVPDDEVTVSLHDNGTAFLYVRNSDYGEPIMTLVMLKTPARVAVANALLGAEPRDDLAGVLVEEPPYVRESFDMLPTTEETADEPQYVYGITSSEIVDAFERGYNAFREDADEGATVARAEGDMLGYERGYVAGYRDASIDHSGGSSSDAEWN